VILGNAIVASAPTGIDIACFVTRLGKAIRMIRFCNGFDPNLTDGNGRPCQCGLIFDDVGHSTVYPHERIPTREEKEKIIAMMDQLTGDDTYCPHGREYGIETCEECDQDEELLEQLLQRFREEYEQELGPWE
jgi:hypothetical protein